MYNAASIGSFETMGIRNRQLKSQFANTEVASNNQKSP